MAKKEQRKMQETKQLKGQDLMRVIEQEYMRTNIPDFKVGDTVDVTVRFKEGDKERTQVFGGVCIARGGSGVREAFTVRRIVQGEGVERVFPLHCPSIVGIKVRRRGKARRAKLYYLRGRTGRAARIKEQFEPKAQQ